jgi:DNA-binding NarL/FixJ family response regulator
MTQQRLKGKKYTRREKNLVLQLLSDGLTQKAIAHKMKMSQRSVEGILVRLRKELNSSSNERMIKVGIQRGIIPLEDVEIPL